MEAIRETCRNCDWLKQTDLGPICNINFDEAKLGNTCSDWAQSADAEYRKAEDYE